MHTRPRELNDYRPLHVMKTLEHRVLELLFQLLVQTLCLSSEAGCWRRSCLPSTLYPHIPGGGNDSSTSPVLLVWPGPAFSRRNLTAWLWTTILCTGFQTMVCYSGGGGGNPPLLEPFPYCGGGVCAFQWSKHLSCLGLYAPGLKKKSATEHRPVPLLIRKTTFHPFGSSLKKTCLVKVCKIMNASATLLELR